MFFVTISNVVLGDSKRLFEGFASSLELEHLGVRQSQFATFIAYRGVLDPRSFSPKWVRMR
jgi:hypothetical protein